jgi:hypothetical protein
LQETNHGMEATFRARLQRLCSLCRLFEYRSAWLGPLFDEAALMRKLRTPISEPWDGQKWERR